MLPPIHNQKSTLSAKPCHPLPQKSLKFEGVFVFEPLFNRQEKKALDGNQPDWFASIATATQQEIKRLKSEQGIEGTASPVTLQTGTMPPEGEDFDNWMKNISMMGEARRTSTTFDEAAAPDYNIRYELYTHKHVNTPDALSFLKKINAFIRKKAEELNIRIVKEELKPEEQE